VYRVGKSVSACLTLAAQVAEKEILSIEGLQTDGLLQPVQQAFIDERAFQCAYCTPGFVLTTPGTESMRGAEIMKSPVA